MINTSHIQSSSQSNTQSSNLDQQQSGTQSCRQTRSPRQHIEQQKQQKQKNISDSDQTRPQGEPGWAALRVAAHQQEYLPSSQPVQQEQAQEHRAGAGTGPEEEQQPLGPAIQIKIILT